GARTIREEIDALRAMGVDPIQALVLPRVLATVTVAFTLDMIVVVVALFFSFVFSVYTQHVSAGAFVDHLTLLTGVGDVIVSIAKATAIGLIGGLLGCYKGLTVSGGPAGVGRAVFETVVFCFVALFTLNLIITAVGAEFTIS
ncbi:MAG: ABC transporter permease, partial [Mycobacterium sp.]